MFRNGSRLLLCVAALCSVICVGVSAEAATISNLTVQPGSTFEIVIELLDGDVSETLVTDVSGTIGPIDLGWTDAPGGPLPDPLQIHGASLELSDAASMPGAPFLFELFGVGADLSGPEVAGFMPDGSMNSFDLVGYLLNLNQGEMVISGGTSVTVDLADTPFPLFISDPGTVIAKVTESATGDPLVYDVTMDISFDFVAEIPATPEVPLPITVFANGTITATGEKIVPEPSSLGLLVLAIGSLMWARQR